MRLLEEELAKHCEEVEKREKELYEHQEELERQFAERVRKYWNERLLNRNVN